MSLPLSLVELLQLLLHCSLNSIYSFFHLINLALFDLYHPLSPLLRPLGLTSTVFFSIQLLPECLALPGLILCSVFLLLSCPDTFSQPIYLYSDALKSLSLLLRVLLGCESRVY